MFCKQTQNTTDTLLRLGLYESSNDNKNKIASLMSKLIEIERIMKPFA